MAFVNIQAAAYPLRPGSPGTGAFAPVLLMWAVCVKRRYRMAVTIGHGAHRA